MSTELAREELSRAAPGRPSAVTIGKFDGVHRGHHHLVQQLQANARERGLASVVITLHPNPITVLRPGTPVTYLCSLEERVGLLRALGVDAVGVLSFTSELAQLSYRDFADLLIERLNMKLLLIGADFALGRRREGTADALRAYGTERGFELVVASLLQEGAGKVGSGAVRDALAAGDVETVAQLLGRSFSLHGPVVRGAERGATIGFPTANVSVAPDLALPAYGVYVTRAHLGDATYDSVTNIGMRPTFDETRPTIEVHLLDFPASGGEADIYERELRIDLLHRLRAEQRFSGVDELVAQIKRDVQATRDFFAAERPS
jgi:riboflavin kinase/FMN adenylyltransferase